MLDVGLVYGIHVFGDIIPAKFLTELIEKRLFSLGDSDSTANGCTSLSAREPATNHHYSVLLESHGLILYCLGMFGVIVVVADIIYQPNY